MKRLHVGPAPNPRRVQMFIAEKLAPRRLRRRPPTTKAGSGPGGEVGIGPAPTWPPSKIVAVDLNAGEHRSAAFPREEPARQGAGARTDDGRMLGESRAICTYLEGPRPEPNLMGRDFDERAFIEMTDRRVELYLMFGFAMAIRHTHLGLAPLEQPQFPEFGRSQGEKVRDVARWFDENSRATRSSPATLHHRRHHRLLRDRVRARAAPVPPADEGATAPAGLARRIAEQPSAKA